ncbi:DUF3732 domain-containing protein [Bradyrhizobium sp.]|uniref:DUF3732 domain-containing protein n=1 Tax=Bradyrhizobium sp. TaxID=376 RepID=UPI001EB98AD9|nr:DUF3732 domain-containing protein [Bradyrhizobium sp.]MBV8921790.1 DUF3732 domain-containing protein [Bradyrhizobium sp.]MBV9980010.1 DUF3732 domain-containing protein [Bradyrhizobium sp.]
MTMQIAKIVLYSHDDHIRELSLNVGRLNVITGASKTGKSALIDIIDYCMGRGDCYVAEGVIRKHVSWFAVLFQLAESQLFVARRNPGPGIKTSPDVYIQRGHTVATPPFSALQKNTTVDALESYLGASIGISENEHRPAAGQTRAPLEANIRHALTFSIQDQDEIDSKNVLFHRQGDNFIAQAIKDTFPYFLGAIDEDRLLKLSQLDAEKRALRRLERQLKEASEVDDADFPQARTLLDEARSVGLVGENVSVPDYPAALSVLKDAVRQDVLTEQLVVGDGEGVLAELRSERGRMRRELETIKLELRATAAFRLESTGYQREAKEQRARLSAVGLFRKEVAEHQQCPLCESVLEVAVPSAAQVADALRVVSEELEAVEVENPRIQFRLASLQETERRIEESLRNNNARILAQIRENDLLRAQRDSFIQQARTIGKITQYLAGVTASQDNSAMVRAIDEAKLRVRALEREIDGESDQERIETYLNIIGRLMTDYSADLDLEHKGSQLRLDIRKLTVIADTLDGPVPLQRMGSGENWVGYHVVTHLALHHWFRRKVRPVPAFLILDQPSQAHYPPEQDADDGSLVSLEDEDKTAVQKLFALINRVTQELAPTFQVILIDHADLKEKWFEDAVVERWRQGDKLVPQDWIS